MIIMKHSTALSVNLNKIALIRNSREGNFPDVAEHGKICLNYGADGLTVHPRPDQRHIRPHDVMDIAELLKDYPDREFNIEGNPFADSINNFPGFLSLVRSSLPDQCTLVPDNNQQLTSDHGFDLRISGEKLTPIINELHDLGIRVSLFMDPDKDQISMAKEIGADRIELYTGPYAATYKNADQGESIFLKYLDAAIHAQKIGIGLNAGHDLNLQNLANFRRVPELLEVSIGHALTVEAISMGLEKTITQYIDLCRA
jgi:pyridoxine 5-phosphate synthase